VDISKFNEKAASAGLADACCHIESCPAGMTGFVSVRKPIKRCYTPIDELEADWKLEVISYWFIV
jgi:hypothetical protein